MRAAQRFGGVITSIRDGAEYKELPPRGPPDELPALTQEEIAALQKEVDGANLQMSDYAYSTLRFVEDDLAPKTIAMPKNDDIASRDLWAIDGSNQRLDHASFNFLLARAALVKFHYADRPDAPYTALKTRDHTGVVLVDGNVFRDEHLLHVDTPKAGEGGQVDVLPLISKGSSKPMLVRFDPAADVKNPKAIALGWAVKLQQALELAMLADVDLGRPGVVIRDGPLFSTSVNPRDTTAGLSVTYAWKDQVLVAVSKRVGESSLLIEALLHLADLRDYWFPGQEITDNTLKGVPSDRLILSRILKPGQRTPLLAAVPRARVEIVNEDERLTPLACYYLSRSKPQSFIRMEVPRFMWDRSPEQVERAFELVAWQHELGKRAPLIQLHADRRCQLQDELALLRRQTQIALQERHIDLPEVYE